MTRFSFRAFRFATRCPGGRGGLHQLPSTAKPAAAKREAPQCDDHPDDLRTIRHGTAVTNLQKGKACPKAGQNRRLHRSADPRRAEARTRRSASKRSFLLDRARPVFFSTRGKRKWGASRWTSPLREQKSPWPPDGGPYHLSSSGRCVPADSR